MKNDYANLKIDKEDLNVYYNDEYHKYWTKDSNLPCVSVTTLIHEFSVFDEDFWSSYKTLEKLVSENEFKIIKDELLKSKKFKKEYLDIYKIDSNLFEEEKRLLLADWEQKRETSCIRGTKIHKEFELGHLNGDTKELQYLNLGGSFRTDTSNKIKVGERSIYSELLLSRISEDGKFRLAGQADLVIVDGFDVFILDYKTSKKIDTKSYYDKNLKRKVTMKYPLNNIEDSNFWVYTLQLSTYAWMIQKIDPRFNIKLLLIIHIDHDNNVTNYECQYLKSDVERMLAFYKNELEHKEFLKSIERIKWE